MSQKRRSRKANQPKQRHESESSEGGEASRTPSSLAIEEVIGVQPEIQKTPKKIDGVKGIAYSLPFMIVFLRLCSKFVIN